MKRSASSAAAQPVPGGVNALEIKWSKAPCRFCGTGCGVMVGVKEGQVVATHGDMQAEVNRGLNCIKGYFLSKIMYGKDRLTTPLLRKRGGVYAKDGEFEPVSWDEAFTVMAEQAKKVLKEKGPTAVGMFGSGQWTIFEGYAATKLMRAGFRSNNLDPNARHCMASAAVANIRSSAFSVRCSARATSAGCQPSVHSSGTWLLTSSNSTSSMSGPKSGFAAAAASNWTCRIGVSGWLRSTACSAMISVSWTHQARHLVVDRDTCRALPRPPLPILRLGCPALLVPHTHPE